MRSWSAMKCFELADKVVANGDYADTNNNNGL